MQHFTTFANSVYKPVKIFRVSLARPIYFLAVTVTGGSKCFHDDRKHMQCNMLSIFLKTYIHIFSFHTLDK